MVPLKMYSAMDLTASALTKMETEGGEPPLYSLWFQQEQVALTVVREAKMFLFMSVRALIGSRSLENVLTH